MLLLQPLRVSFSRVWLSWKQECSTLSQILLLKIWAKRGVFRCRLVKLHEEGYSEGKYLKNWSSVKTAIHQWYLPPLLHGPIEVRFCKGISHNFHGMCKPMFSGRFVGSETKLITETTFKVDVLASAPVSNKSGQFFLLKVVGERTPIFFILWSSLGLVTMGPPALLKSWKLPNVLNLVTAWWIAVLLNFSFSDICLSEYPFSCNIILFDLSTPDKTTFLSIFSAAKLGIILNILAS